MSGNKLEVFDKDTLTKTEERVQEMREDGDLDFPPNFSPENALKSAWLQLQNHDQNVLNDCSRSSVMNALLETVIQGLNPAKDQVYYVPFGNQLTTLRSAPGDIYLAKQMAGVDRVYANLIYEGDEINIKTVDGRTVVTDHDQKWANMSQDNIAGAYAVVKFKDDRPDKYELMRLEEIEQAWAMRKGKDKTKAHKNFPGEMCKKTVIHRALKYIINSSSDEHLFEQAEDRAEVAQAQEERDDKVEGTESEVIDVSDEGEDASGPDKEGSDKSSENGTQDTLVDPEDEKTDIEKEEEHQRQF